MEITGYNSINPMDPLKDNTAPTCSASNNYHSAQNILTFLENFKNQIPTMPPGHPEVMQFYGKALENILGCSGLVSGCYDVNPPSLPQLDSSILAEANNIAGSSNPLDAINDIESKIKNILADPAYGNPSPADSSDRIISGNVLDAWCGLIKAHSINNDPDADGPVMNCIKTFVNEPSDSTGLTQDDLAALNQNISSSPTDQNFNNISDYLEKNIIWPNSSF